MSGKTLTLSILALAIVGIAVSVQAQQNYSRDDDRAYSPKAENRTLFERMEDFGRNLFGGDELVQKAQPQKSRSVQRGENYSSGSTAARQRYATSPADDASRAAPARSGSVSRAAARDGYTYSRSSESSTESQQRSRSSYAKPSPAASEPSRSYRSAQSSSGATSDGGVVPSEQALPQRGYVRGGASNESSAISSDSPRPLYERMNAARKSAFSGSTTASVRGAGSPSPVFERPSVGSSPVVAAPQAARVVPADNDPVVAAPAAKSEPASAVAVPTIRTDIASAAAAAAASASASPTPAISTTPSPAASVSQPPAAEPPSAPSTSSATNAVEPPATSASSLTKDVEPSATTASSATNAVEPPAAPASSATSAVEPPAAGTAVAASPVVEKSDSTDRGDVLLTRRSPNLSVETIGPRRISVGKESKYEITMVNSGEVAADELLVTVDLPTWADVAGGEPSVGTTQSVSSGTSGRQFQWKLLRLDSKSRERLVLRIVPRESRPFDLGVKWTYRESATQAMIEVQEPKLTLNLDGPREVLFGKKELFKLRVGNVGNGDAENVIIKLYPLGANQGGAASHNFGTVPAGQSRSIEVELTARQTGTLAVKVEVACDGAGRAELAEKVVVRRASLDLEIAGPKRQYVEAPVAYRVRVSNSGTAPAANVVVTAAIPSAMKFQSAGSDGQLESGGRRVRWKLDMLRPGAEKTLELKCTLAQAGPVRLQVDCAGEDLTTSAVAVTEVDAMADLVMDVIDPAGPVAVGQEATYEIRIHNRGSKAAEDLELAAFFSQGIEPIRVDGPSHKITLGQVAFPRIPTVAPGGEVRLTIRAKAQMAGNHVFRAELQCRPTGTHLASEETTYFYGESDVPQVLARSSDSTAERTADRRAGAPASSAPATGQGNRALR